MILISQMYSSVTAEEFWENFAINIQTQKIGKKTIFCNLRERGILMKQNEVDSLWF